MAIHASVIGPSIFFIFFALLEGGLARPRSGPAVCFEASPKHPSCALFPAFCHVPLSMGVPVLTRGFVTRPYCYRSSLYWPLISSSGCSTYETRGKYRVHFIRFEVTECPVSLRITLQITADLVNQKKLLGFSPRTLPAIRRLKPATKPKPSYMPAVQHDPPFDMYR